MANSSIDIASNALILIGDDPINSFNDPGAGATAASNLYQEVKETALAFHPWTWALKEQELSRLSATPDSRTNFQFAFQKPTDMIRIWKVMPHSYYEEVGDLIYSNEPSLFMRYIFDVAETSMSASFVKALEYQLAAEMAISVTEDEKKAALYERKAEKQIIKASNINSQGHPQQTVVDSPFIDARRSGSGSNGRGL